MTLSTPAELMPLQVDSDGVMRVGGTRVTLDTVIAIFEQGATAEEIVQRFPTLDLADVYFAIGYYLRHRQEVDDYLSHIHKSGNTALILSARDMDSAERRRYERK